MGAVKRLLAFILAASACLGTAALAADGAPAVSAPHAVLMEEATGCVVFEKDADARVPPASVTKVMTILLIVEALERDELSLDDTVTASANAESMGGSQIYLEAGEAMSVRDMLKSIVVASANDAAVAIAEHICGTEADFVERMNARAAELGLQNTNFTNCTGLFEDSSHYTSARDVAVMAREVMSHEMVKDYTTIWMDSVRNGEFGLSNTNKLVHSYSGCTGLKTGYTSAAGHCLAATAERGGTEFIAVVMGCESSDSRFADAAALLDYGFSAYELVRLLPDKAIPPVRVLVGEKGSVQPVPGGEQYMLLHKTEAGNLSYEIELPEEVTAPVAEGQELGRVRVLLDGAEAAQLSLVSPEAVSRKGPVSIFLDLLDQLFG